MSAPYIGNFALNAKVYIPFNTNGQDGAAITYTTTSTEDPIKLYRDGGTTERSSLAGITTIKDHDGDTGTHLIEICTTDDTDAGFYASGHEYQVKKPLMTIDTKIVNAWLACFSIGRS